MLFYYFSPVNFLIGKFLFTRDAELAEEKLKTLLGLGLQESPLQLVPTPTSSESDPEPSDLLDTVFAARNSIMLVSHYQHLQLKEKQPFGFDLIIRGAKERLAPILMTAMTTALALLAIIVTPWHWLF